VNTQTTLATPPLLRGYLHLATAVVTPYALVHLLFSADSPRGFVGGAIYGSSLILMYTTSAIYHLIPWGASHRNVVRRVDHSMIFIFIGGTYTPFALMLLSNEWGIPILSVVWGLVGMGVIQKIIAPSASRRFRVSIYLAIGWIGLIAVFQLAAALTVEALVLIVGGGLLYSVGGVTYAKRWPDPFPRVFGYHEVFHSLVVLASAVFWVVIATYVLPY